MRGMEVRELVYDEPGEAQEETLVLNFFMAYQESAQEGGRWIVKLPQIRRHYCRSWFLIDLVSVLPFDLITHLELVDTSTGGFSMLRLVRTVRLIRLVKLLRILRASRILARWRSYLGISYAMTSLIKFFCATFFMVYRHVREAHTHSQWPAACPAPSPYLLLLLDRPPSDRPPLPRGR